MMRKILDFCCEKEQCCACYACVNICPQQCIIMSENSDGFHYPKIQENICVNCGLCEKVCPVINVQAENNSATLVVYAANNKREEVRLNSSSGGVFTALAEAILAQGGIVFGVTLSKDCRFALHTAVESTQDLHLLRGSKYIQSSIGDTYTRVKHFLKVRKVLFTGTPCQIEGLLSFLQKPYENLYCMDIICFGVPSSLVWRNYLDFQEQKNTSKVSHVSFRYKKYGWKRPGLQLLFKSHTEYMVPLSKDLFMQLFLKGIGLRPSCHHCVFKKKHRLSDITAADLWGIQNICPQFDDNKGSSAVFIHSKKGKKLFESIAYNFLYLPVSSEEVIKYNPYMVRSVAKYKNYSIFFEELHKQPFNLLAKKHTQISLMQRIKKGIINCIRLVLLKIGLLEYIKQLYVK